MSGQLAHFRDAVRVSDDPDASSVAVELNFLDRESQAAIVSDVAHVLADCDFDVAAILGQACDGDDDFVVLRPEVAFTAGPGLVGVGRVQKLIFDKLHDLLGRGALGRDAACAV